MTRTKSSRALLSVVLAVLMAAAFMPSLTYSSFASTSKKATKVTKLNHRGGTVYAKVGNKYTLKYSLSPSKLTSAAKKTAWKTSDKNVVKIIAVNGRHATIKAKQNGYANVKVYCKNNHKAQATWRIKVSKKATEIVINTDKVQKEYGLATKYNKVKTDLTKSDLLNGVVATVNGKEVKLTEDNVTIGDPINKKIIKTTNTDPDYLWPVLTEATYPITYKVTAADGTVGTKTINVTVENQAPVLNTQDVTVAINKDKEKTKATITDEDFLNKAIKSVDDYESFASDAKDKSLKAWTDLTKNNVSTDKNKVEITKVVNAEGKDITGTEEWKLSNIRVAEATTYTVTVKATDFLGATTTKDVKLTVQANQAPTIATDSVKLTKDTTVANLKTQIFNQLTYNDAEDGQGVAASKANTKDGFQLEFEDSDTNKLFTDKDATVDAAKLAKVKYVVVTGLKDQDGASAQAKRLSVSFVDAPVITIKDNEGTTADTARVYIPYVSENTHQAVMTLADAYKYVSAKYDGADVKLVTAADVKADDAAVKKNNPKAHSDLVPNLTSDIEDSGKAASFSLDPRKKGDTETVNFKVTITDPTTKQTVTTTQKVVFKVVDSADKAAQIAYDKSVDAKTAKPSTDSKTVYDDNGIAVDKSAVDALNKVTFTTDTTSTKDRVVLIVNNAPKGATFAWSYNGAAKSDQTKNSITVDPKAYPGTYVVTVTYDGLTATHTYTVK